MSQERFGAKVLWVGLASVLLYFGLFAGIEYRRSRQGPWAVTFTRATNGLPCLEISQPKLGIRDVRLVFPDAFPTNPPALPQRYVFDTARPTPFDLPFGQCVFLDTLSLPGTVTLEIAGRQVQLLPRVLTLDGRERPWQAGETIQLPPRRP